MAGTFDQLGVLAGAGAVPAAPGPVPGAEPADESLASATPGTPANDRKWDRILDEATRHQKDEQKRWDKFLELYRDGQFRTGGHEASDAELGGEDGESCSANITYQHITILLSVLMAQAPQHEVEPTGAPSAAFAGLAPYVGQSPEALQRAFADSLEEVLREGYRCGRMKAHDEAAMGEALIRGQAFTKVGWDPKTARDKLSTIRRDEVYLDPHARYDLGASRYLVQTICEPVEVAREFFAKQFGLPPGKILPNREAAQGKGLAEQAISRGVETHEKDLFRYHEIWSTEGDKLTVRYKKWMAKGSDWLVPGAEPTFATAYGAFPWVELCFNRQWLRCSDAFPELHVVEGTRRVYEELFDYVQKHTRRNLGLKYLYDQGLVDKDTLQRMLSSVDTEFIPVELGGKSLSDFILELDLGRKQRPDVEIAEFVRGTHDRIAGIDELLQGARSGDMTAKEASIRDAWGRLRVGRMIEKVDEWQEAVAQLRAQACRVLMAPERVQTMAKHPLAGLLFEMYAGSPEALVQEFSIGVATGSTGRTHKLERLERLEKAFGLGKEINGAYGLPVVDLVQLFVAMLELQDERRPERFLNAQVLGLPAGGMLPDPAAAGPSAGGTPTSPAQAPAAAAGSSGPASAEPGP